MDGSHTRIIKPQNDETTSIYIVLSECYVGKKAAQRLKLRLASIHRFGHGKST